MRTPLLPAHRRAQFDTARKGYVSVPVPYKRQQPFEPPFSLSTRLQDQVLRERLIEAIYCFVLAGSVIATL